VYDAPMTAKALSGEWRGLPVALIHQTQRWSKKQEQSRGTVATEQQSLPELIDTLRRGTEPLGNMSRALGSPGISPSVP
jgi:hypothetical protein